MAPLIVQLVVTAVVRWFVPLKDAVRIGLAVMFLFTAGSHFSSLKYDLAAMIPPPLTGALWVIYLTGILEFVGACGMVTRSLRRPAAWGLIGLLIGLFPANVYAAISGVTLGGNPPTALLVRAPLQLFWIGLLWWSATGHCSNQMDSRSSERTRAAAILLIVILSAGCSAPASTPVTVAAAPTNAMNDDLEQRVDTLIADLRSREAADRQRRTHPVNLETDTIRETTRVDQRMTDDREPAVAGPTPTDDVVIKSSLDEMRERAADAFESRVAELQRQSAALVRRRHEASAACSGTTSGTSLGAVIGPIDQIPPPIPAPNANISLTMGNIEIANETTPQCRSMRAGVNVEETAMKLALDALDNDARRAGIYPGVMRELFAKYDLRR